VDQKFIQKKNMLKSNSSKVLIMGVFFTALITIFINQASASDYYLGRPAVPTKFENPEGVQRYLKHLQKYYLLVGRPRFVFYYAKPDFDVCKISKI
jgi:hypothetical protein